MLATSYRTAYNEDHEAFRDTVRKVFAEHLTPHMEEHEANGIVPRDVWKKMGDAGMLCMTVKEENGGLGLDFGFNCVLTEELSYLGSSAGFTLQNDITANYFERLGNDEQRAKYEDQLAELRLRLVAAEEKSQRALSISRLDDAA